MWPLALGIGPQYYNNALYIFVTLIIAPKKYQVVELNNIVLTGIAMKSKSSQLEARLRSGSRLFKLLPAILMLGYSLESQMTDNQSSARSQVISRITNGLTYQVNQLGRSTMSDLSAPSRASLAISTDTDDYFMQMLDPYATALHAAPAAISDSLAEPLSGVQATGGPPTESRRAIGDIFFDPLEIDLTTKPMLPFVRSISTPDEPMDEYGPQRKSRRHSKSASSSGARDSGSRTRPVHGKSRSSPRGKKPDTPRNDPKGKTDAKVIALEQEITNLRAQLGDECDQREDAEKAVAFERAIGKDALQTAEAAGRNASHAHDMETAINQSVLREVGQRRDEFKHIAQQLEAQILTERQASQRQLQLQVAECNKLREERVSAAAAELTSREKFESQRQALLNAIAAASSESDRAAMLQEGNANLTAYLAERDTQLREALAVAKKFDTHAGDGGVLAESNREAATTELVRHVKNQENAMNMLEGTCANLRGEVNQLKLDSAKLKQPRTQVEQYNERHKNEIEQLRARFMEEIQKAVKRIEDLQSRVKILKDKNQTLAGDAMEKDNEVMLLREDVSRLTQRVIAERAKDPPPGTTSALRKSATEFVPRENTPKEPPNKAESSKVYQEALAALEGVTDAWPEENDSDGLSESDGDDGTSFDRPDSVGNSAGDNQPPPSPAHAGGGAPVGPPPSALRTPQIAPAATQQPGLAPADAVGYSSRVKEVKVPRFPKINELKTFYAKLGRNLWSASHFTDRAEIKWLGESLTKSYEELEDSGEARFSHLDALLSQSLEKILPSDLYRTFQAKSEAALDTGGCVNGRQICWLICNYYKTSSHMTMIYSYQHLDSLKWYGDHRVPEFRHQWLRLVDNLKDPLGEETLRDMLATKISESRIAFKDDMNHYNRERGKSRMTKVDSPDYSYVYLLGIMERHCCDQLENRQLDALKAGISPGKAGGGYDDDQHPGAPAEAKTAKRRARREANKKNKADANAANQPTQKPPDVPATPAKGTGGKGKSRDRSRGPSTGKGGGNEAKGGKGKGICWNHQNFLQGNTQTDCKWGGQCSFNHDVKLSKKEFGEMRKPSKSPSAGNRQGGKGNAKDGASPLYTVNKDGIKIPSCCRKHYAGSCDNHERYGAVCMFRHLTKAAYAAEYKGLNGVLPPP